MARNDSKYTEYLAYQVAFEIWQKRIEAIKDDILRYKSDCEMVEDAVECKMCNKMMFDSILSIIDKHTKGESNGSNKSDSD